MLDELIDGVAREMTASQPDAALTRRVAARVAELESEGHRRRKWQPVWLLAPVAVCSVVLAVLVIRDRPPSAVPRSSVTSRTVPTDGRVPDTLTALSSVAQATLATPRGQARRQASDAKPRSTAPKVVATLDPDLAPLVTAPLEIEPLGVAPLAQAAPIAPIEVDALLIGRIDIAAMP